MSMNRFEASEFNRTSETNDTLTDENTNLYRLITDTWIALQEVQTLLSYEVRVARAEEDAARQISMENLQTRVITAMNKLAGE